MKWLRIECIRKGDKGSMMKPKGENKGKNKGKNKGEESAADRFAQAPLASDDAETLALRQPFVAVGRQARRQRRRVHRRRDGGAGRGRLGRRRRRRRRRRRQRRLLRLGRRRADRQRRFHGRCQSVMKENGTSRCVTLFTELFTG